MNKTKIISRVIRNRVIILISLLLTTIGLMTTIIVFSQVKNGIRKEVIYKARTDLELGYQYINMKYPGNWREIDGKLYKGDLLINDNVTLINDIVYYTGGTATLFHHKKRVTTNVMTKDGKRAIGTFVSAKVAKKVLEKGDIYLGPANVVGHNYQTAYMPLKNSKKEIIGMWYVGVSEEYINNYFSLLVKDILFLFFTLLVAVTLVSIYFASGFFVPIRNIEIINEKVEQKNRELKEAYEKVEHLANTDFLTGLLNRRAMIKSIEAEENRFSRNEKEFVLIMIDIDNFKNVNDKYGHKCGDDVLQVITSLLESIIRKQDSFSRWGGEEFLLMITETGIKDAHVVGEKMRQAVEREAFQYDELNFNVTITLGIAEYNNTSNIDQCIRSADEALYQGKRDGKNKVVLYN